MKALYKTCLVIGLFIVVGAFFLVKPDVPLPLLEEQYFNGASQYIEIGGLNVHYRQEGEGKDTLVLLHGTGASLHTWEGWVRELRHKYVLVSLDLPGYGLTGPSHDGAYTIESYVEFLNSFMSRLGISTFSLVGNSLGGNIAWNYSLTFKEKVSALVLINSGGFPQQSSAGIFALARNPILGPMVKYITPRMLIENNLKEVYADDNKLTDSLIDRYYQMARRPGNRQAFIDRAKTQSKDRSALISQIITPTLILWGEQDTWIPVEMGYQFKEELINDSLVVFDNLGHVPMEEDPISTARVVLEYLDHQLENNHS